MLNSNRDLTTVGSKVEEQAFESKRQMNIVDDAGKDSRKSMLEETDAEE